MTLQYHKCGGGWLPCLSMLYVAMLSTQLIQALHVNTFALSPVDNQSYSSYAGSLDTICEGENKKFVPICDSDVTNRCECKKGSRFQGNMCVSFDMAIALYVGSVILAQDYSCQVHQDLKIILKDIVSSKIQVAETYLQRQSLNNTKNINFFVAVPDTTIDIHEMITMKCVEASDGTCTLASSQKTVTLKSKDSIQKIQDYDMCSDEDNECSGLIHHCRTTPNSRFICSCLPQFEEVFHSRNTPICRVKDLCATDVECKEKNAECTMTPMGVKECKCLHPLFMSVVDEKCHTFCEAHIIECQNGGKCDDVTKSCQCSPNWVGVNCTVPNYYRMRTEEYTKKYSTLVIVLSTVLTLLIASNIISICVFRYMKSGVFETKIF